MQLVILLLSNLSERLGVEMKKRYVVPIILGVTLLVGGGAYQYYEHTQYESSVTKQIAIIQKAYKQACNEKDDTKKLEDLKKMKSELANYQKGKAKDERVIKEYNSSINQLVTYFKDKNDKVLKENTYDSSKETNKDVLQSKVNNLNTLLKTVEGQKGIVYSTKTEKVTSNEEKNDTKADVNKDKTSNSKKETQKATTEYDDYVIKIKEIIDGYNNKLEQIKAEEQRKAEEARKAGEEAARKVEEERQRQIAEQKAKSNKMNFEEIRAFNFQSIQSEWQPVAIAINYHNGEGYVWETNVRESNLNVTTTQISGKMAGLLFNLDANGLSTENSTNLPIHLNVTEGVLNIASADGGMAWNILFYPKEVEIEKLRPDDSLPESIHANTEHIAVRSSGMGGPTVVYERMS